MLDETVVAGNFRVVESYGIDYTGSQQIAGATMSDSVPAATLYFAEYRVHAGLTQAEVARAIGRATDTLTAWENGRNSPTARDMLKMANLYGIHPGQFFARHGRYETTREAIDHIVSMSMIAGIEPAAFVIVDGDMSSLTYAQEVSDLLVMYRSLAGKFRNHVRMMMKSLTEISAKANDDDR